MRIFIVDDEEIACFGLRGMIGRIFESDDNEFYAFTSSAKALSEAKRLRPDLIFLDITMPEMDGIEFTEAIKKVYSPEIIIISGNDDYNIVRQCFKLNVSDYLLKPIEFDELKKILLKFQDSSKSKAVGTSQNIIKFPFVFTAIVKGRDIKEEFKNNILNIKNMPSLEGEMEISSKKERIFDTVFTFRFFEKFDYYRAVREFGRLFDDLADSTGSVVKGAVSSLYSSNEDEVAFEEMISIFKSRIYSNKSILYSQQNKILRDGVDDPDYYSSVALLPNIFSFDFKEKYGEFILKWFATEKLGSLSYDIINKWYDSIIGRIINDSNLGEELEIRNFKDFNTIEEILFELNRLVDGISVYYMESNQDDKSVIEQTIKFINNNYQKNINLATVSNHYNLNYSYFSRVFKDSMGISFSQYLLNVRMEKAKELLLKDSELKISDIATIVGYSGDNIQNFTRAFKKHFGKSPKNFKN